MTDKQIDDKVNDIYKEMKIGPISIEEEKQLRNIVKQNIDAFAFSIDDIGKFKGFKYPLKYKKDANPKAAYTKPYPASIQAQKDIAEWIERMLKAEVIIPAPIDIEYQSACFVVPKRDGKKKNCSRYAKGK